MKKLAMKMLSLLLVLSLLLPTCVFAQPGQDGDGTPGTQGAAMEDADAPTGGGNSGENADTPAGAGTATGTLTRPQEAGTAAGTLTRPREAGTATRPRRTRTEGR